jgi:outer membrane murein-binding lipoprotein Lpp
MHADENRRKYDGLTDSQKIDRILECLDELAAAFPYGIEDHKAEHERTKAAKEEADKFITDLKFTMAKSSIMAFVLFMLGLIATGIFDKLREFIRGVPHV